MTSITELFNKVKSAQRPTVPLALRERGNGGEGTGMALISMVGIIAMPISNAWAEGAPAAQGAGFMEFLPLVALLAVFYFLILRPQQKRAKEHKAMLEAMQKGDEVVTAGGVLGKVTKVGDDNIAVEIADNVVVQVQKSAVQSVLPKGTIKSV